jgi:S1-C subfamily serine protease
VDEHSWSIQRDLIEFYATHIRELEKLGAVWTHRDATGAYDGFRVGLSRCSVLRQGGLRSGDIVHDVNGRHIHTVLQAVGAYLALRAEPHLQLHITRRGKPLELSYAIEPATAPPKKGRR